MTQRIITTTMLAALAGFLFFGCDKSDEQPFSEELVLDGHMIVGRPPSVHLSHTLPIDQYYDPAAVSVSGAAVQLWVEDHPYTMHEDAAHHGTYTLPADSHIVTTGLAYRIEVRALGKILSAQTLEAAPPLRIDSTSFPVWRDSVNMGSVDFAGTEFFLRWNEDARRVGVIHLIENLEPDWYADYRNVDANNGMNVGNLWIWTERHGTTFRVPWISVGHMGRHRILTISGDDAAYNYYQTLQLGTSENYPLSNVHGGLGLFCAVSIDTSYFYLTMKLH
jgi:hypothetical protein